MIDKPDPMNEPEKPALLKPALPKREPPKFDLKRSEERDEEYRDRSGRFGEKRLDPNSWRDSRA
jgi:hypothetical protein